MSVVPVDELDFLPADFHARRRQRRVRQWRFAVAGGFVALIVAGLIGNRLQHARLAAEVEQLKPRAAAVAELERRLVESEAQVASFGLSANLRARLRLQPATTRLLAAVTGTLPATISLTELQLGPERAGEGAKLISAAAVAADDTELPPVRRDLIRLAAETSRSQELVVVGVAPDDSTISDYLAGLRETSAFDDVQLMYIGGYDHRGFPMRSFSIRLRVRQPVPDSAGIAEHPGEGDNGGAV